VLINLRFAEIKTPTRTPTPKQPKTIITRDAETFQRKNLISVTSTFCSEKTTIKVANKMAKKVLNFMCLDFK
jgi:hypothetical protein